jgi:cytoskeletal protein CcmA (bactofilin family)
MFNRHSNLAARGVDSQLASTIPAPIKPLPTTMTAANTSSTIAATATAIPSAIDPHKAMLAERADANHLSIIGNDLSIMGERIVIITKGTLQVDGEVQGDLHGAEVIIGESGKVTGTICGDTVEVRGHVSGTIKGSDVRLLDTSVVEGDIYHHSIAIAAGAHFDGRVRRPKDISELKPVLDPSRHAAAPALNS